LIFCFIPEAANPTYKFLHNIFKFNDKYK